MDATTKTPAAETLTAGDTVEVLVDYSWSGAKKTRTATVLSLGTSGDGIPMAVVKLHGGIVTRRMVSELSRPA